MHVLLQRCIVDLIGLRRDWSTAARFDMILSRSYFVLRQTMHAVCAEVFEVLAFQSGQEQFVG